ncbi:MAG: hypothetical protein HGA19_10770 [Oscillochloris sp.]|nr:hypothetical protein [Oscillochloris sp.]
MASPPNTTRPTGAPRARTLLTTAALAATVTGWAIFSTQSSTATAFDTASTRVVAPAWLQQAPHIATLPEVATVRPISAARELIVQSQSAAAPVAAAPAATPAPVPTLRVVTVPQAAARPAISAPVTSTRSSR